MKVKKECSLQTEANNRARRGAVVARQAHNLEVSGSNPLAATSSDPPSGHGRFLSTHPCSNVNLETPTRTRTPSLSHSRSPSGAPRAEVSLAPYVWMLCGSFSFAIMGTCAHALGKAGCDWRYI